tara:strand:- start:3420 stop:3806 length:387 start_codon:yes stop_codon:yes gene_type:complete
METTTWQELANIHALNDYEIENLMSCRPSEIVEMWQMSIVSQKLLKAYTEKNNDDLIDLLCILTRANIGVVVSKKIVDTVFRIALVQEDRVSLPMASCVRVARVLACKLDRLGQLVAICDKLPAVSND